jgi:hypothetical protein
MRLSEKAQAALERVVERFKTGDLSPIVEVVRIELPPDCPTSKWTLNNRILAYMQTGSLDCRGYNQWKDVGRYVKRGSKAAYILAPHLVTIENEETGEKEKRLCGFLAVPVFPYHVTGGEEAAEVDYAPRDLPPLVEAARELGVKVTWQPLPESRLGDCSISGEKINVGTSDPAVFFHELAHAVHAKLNGTLKGGQQADQETVAEFTAAVLMELYGLGDRTGNAWQYIQGYNADPIKAVMQALSTVEKVLKLLEEAAEARETEGAA